MNKLNQSALIRDYKAYLHKCLIKTQNLHWYNARNSEYKKYHYWNGRAKGLMSAVQFLNEVDGDIGLYSKWLYMEIERLINTESASQKGMLGGLLDALMKLDGLTKKRRYRVKG